MTKCKNVQHISLADKPSFLRQIQSGCDKVMLQICGPLAVKAMHNRAMTDDLVRRSSLGTAPLNAV